MKKNISSKWSSKLDFNSSDILNKKIFNFLFILITLQLNFSCSSFHGKELGNVTIDKLSNDDSIFPKDLELTLKKGENIYFWTKMDYECSTDSNVFFLYKIQCIINKSDTLGVMILDVNSYDISNDELESHITNAHFVKFTRRLCVLPIEKDGNYQFRVLLVSNVTDQRLRINKAELIIKDE
jgi:hypothetical protein